MTMEVDSEWANPIEEECDIGEFYRREHQQQNMKSLGEVEEHLAEKAEPVLGFKPSSSFKRSPIGILIYVVCGVLALISMRVAGAF